MGSSNKVVVFGPPMSGRQSIVKALCRGESDQFYVMTGTVQSGFFSGLAFPYLAADVTTIGQTLIVETLAGGTPVEGYEVLIQPKSRVICLVDAYDYASDPSWSTGWYCQAEGFLPQAACCCAVFTKVDLADVPDPRAVLADLGLSPELPHILVSGPDTGAGFPDATRTANFILDVLSKQLTA